MREFVIGMYEAQLDLGCCGQSPGTCFCSLAKTGWMSVWLMGDACPGFPLAHRRRVWRSTRRRRPTPTKPVTTGSIRFSFGLWPCGLRDGDQRCGHRNSEDLRFQRRPRLTVPCNPVPLGGSSVQSSLRAEHLMKFCRGPPKVDECFSVLMVWKQAL